MPSLTIAVTVAPLLADAIWPVAGGILFALLAWFALIPIFPGLLLRPLWWVLCHTIYRLRVTGRDRVPGTGGVLLVCNHVSWVDWMLIRAATPRPVRFVVASGHNTNWALRWAIRIQKGISVDANAGPRAIIAALKEVSKALDAGDVVCVFPEARLTRNGTMLPFRRGFERVVKQCEKTPAVVPVWIGQMWGSIFSYRGGRIVRKWPARIPYPATVTFGEPVPATTTAAELRLTLQALSADATIAHIRVSWPAHRAFVRMACRFRQMNRPCYIETNASPAKTLSYLRALVGAICLTRVLRKTLTHDRYIGTWLPSSVGGALANIAIALMRKTSVNLNYTAGREAVTSAVGQTGLKVILSSKRFLSRVPLETPEGVRVVELEDIARQVTKGMKIRALLEVALLPGWFLDRFVLKLSSHSVEDIATVIFSSGSTGEPKGVMLSHGNIVSNGESLIGAIDLSHTDRMLGILPFFHSFGYTVTMWAPLQIGASTVFHADPRQALEVGKLCRDHQCTMLLATATFLRFYLKRCEPDDFKSLRILVCGAEKLPVPLAKEFEAKFGILPLEGYGCTELSPVVSANLPDQEINGLVQVANKFGTIGHPIPGVAARVVDPESEIAVIPGHEGMIQIRGANVMVGYLNRPDMTAKAIRDGWYTTGDMGHIDDDGFITITGRLSRFAKIGGEMIPLEKVEEDMHAVLGTAERILTVTAVPDPKRGERLIVLHLPTLTMPIKDLLKGLSEKGLPNLWIPGEKDFYGIDEMPVLGTGKLDLRGVQEMAKSKAG